MSEPVSLLPPNATPLDLAHELTDAARSPDTSVVRKVKDALLCEARFLGVLAWEHSVDFWLPEWAEDKQRFVVDQWDRYEQLKTTPEGFKRFYALVGAKLLKITSPPQHVFAGRNWTTAERQRYLAQFQQIRIYPKVPVQEFRRGFFVASVYRSRAYVGHVAPTAYRVTIDTHVREARLYDPTTGLETVLTRREMVKAAIPGGTVYDFEDIVLPKRRFGFYVGDTVGNFKGTTHFLNADDAPQRVIRTEIQRPGGVAVSRPQWSSVVPDARLISIYPDLIRERFFDRGPFLDGRTSTGKRTAFYGARDYAWKHVYERFYVYDRTRDKGVTAGEPGSYVGRARLGMTPYTAIMKVEIRGKRRRTEFVDRPGQYLTRDPIKIPLERALAAARACKAGRDTIWHETKTRRPRRFGDHIRFGDRIIFGEKVEA